MGTNLSGTDYLMACPPDRKLTSCKTAWSKL